MDAGQLDNASCHTATDREIESRQTDKTRTDREKGSRQQDTAQRQTDRGRRFKWSLYSHEATGSRSAEVVCDGQQGFREIQDDGGGHPADFNSLGSCWKISLPTVDVEILFL